MECSLLTPRGTSTNTVTRTLECDNAAEHLIAEQSSAEQSSAMLAADYDRDLSDYLLCLCKQDNGLWWMQLGSSGRFHCGLFLDTLACWVCAGKACDVSIRAASVGYQSISD
jgi:hypothetical protein